MNATSERSCTLRRMPSLKLHLRERPVAAPAVGAAALGLLVFGLLAMACHQAGRPVLFDSPVERWLMPATDDHARFRAARFVVNLASPPIQIAAGALVALGILLLSRSVRWAWVALLAPAVAGIAEILLKAMVARPGIDAVEVASSAEASFPSGHATGVGARATVMVLVAVAARGSRLARWLAAGVASTAAMVLAVSLVVARDHYPTDVAGGLILAASTSTLVAAAIMREP